MKPQRRKQAHDPARDSLAGGDEALMFTQIGVCERIDTAGEPDELSPLQQPVEVLRGDADGG